MAESLDEIPGSIKNLPLEQLQQLAWSLYKTMSQVSRLEVIGPEGREYVRYFKDEEFMHYMLQDDNRTLKIFIEDCK